MDSPNQKNADTEEPKKPYELEDLWKKADEGERRSRVMTFEEMDEAKAMRPSLE
ncbi:MAG: hypothetical protein ACP5M4_07605 [Acidobacteriaceae bacterium]